MTALTFNHVLQTMRHLTLMSCFPIWILENGVHKLYKCSGVNNSRLGTNMAKIGSCG
jgi:hypothetical protein